MNFIPRTGWVILLPAPDQTREGRVRLPDARRKKRVIASVLAHNCTAWWEAYGETALLFGTQVLVEKWSWRILKIEDMLLYVVPERAILAILQTEEGKDSVKRDELIKELQSRVEAVVVEQVDTNREVEQEDIDEIEGELNEDWVSDTANLDEDVDEVEQEDEA